MEDVDPKENEVSMKVISINILLSDLLGLL